MSDRQAVHMFSPSHARARTHTHTRARARTCTFSPTHTPLGLCDRQQRLRRYVRGDVFGQILSAVKTAFESFFCTRCVYNDIGVRTLWEGVSGPKARIWRPLFSSWIGMSRTENCSTTRRWCCELHRSKRGPNEWKARRHVVFFVCP